MMELTDDEKRGAGHLFYDPNGNRWMCFTDEVILKNTKELEGHEKCFVVRTSEYHLSEAERMEIQMFGFAIHDPPYFTYFPSITFVRMLAHQILKDAKNPNHDFDFEPPEQHGLRYHSVVNSGI
nr:hypothetical protein [Candidatus Njordarchaeota archaeon]